MDPRLLTGDTPYELDNHVHFRDVGGKCGAVTVGVSPGPPQVCVDIARRYECANFDGTIIARTRAIQYAVEYKVTVLPRVMR